MGDLRPVMLKVYLDALSFVRANSLSPRSVKTCSHRVCLAVWVRFQVIAVLFFVFLSYVEFRRMPKFICARRLFSRRALEDQDAYEMMEALAACGSLSLRLRAWVRGAASEAASGARDKVFAPLPWDPVWRV